MLRRPQAMVAASVSSLARLAGPRASVQLEIHHAIFDAVAAGDAGGVVTGPARGWPPWPST